MTLTVEPPAGAVEQDVVVELLVARLHPQLGGDPEVLRARAVEVLAVFAGARVRTFVPILAEKRLRRLYADAPRGTGDGER